MIDQAPFGVAVAADSIRFERLLPGSPERLWAWLTDSDKRGRWLASGVMPSHPGAVFDMHFEHARLSDEVAAIPERYAHLKDGHVSQHRVIRFEPPRVLAISWSDGAGGESEVTFELTPHDQDVRLVLTHRRLANREVLRSVGKGWHTHLTVLTEKLNGHAPKAFWTLMGQVADRYDREIEGD